MFITYPWFGVKECGVSKHDHGLVTSLQLQKTRPKPGNYMDSLSDSNHQIHFLDRRSYGSIH